MIKLLITGANGQIGMEFRELAKISEDFGFIFTDIDELDITDENAVNEFFQNNDFDYCINCAAYTAVDKAETEMKKANLLNAKAVEFLAKACYKKNTPFFQLSSDYVYHGEQNTPYIETDKTNPQGVYALTKNLGDMTALRTLPYSSIIIRTSWVYSSFGNNFVKTRLRFGAERDTLNVVFDQIGTPTYAKDIAEIILKMIKTIETDGKFSKFPAGIYHFSNEGVTSWYDFAKAIFKIKNIKCNVNPIETKDYPTPAKRPHFSILNKSKIKETFGLKIPHWEDSLEECLKLL